MTHTLTLQSIEPVTHNVFRLKFDRPDGYTYTPGQATDLALDREGWRDEKRPFTFTSLPDEPCLEFTIKSYPDHDGVTEQIGKMSPGDTVLIGDPWGAIEDKGDGVFIAGGAGVTPFIAILRKKLVENGTLEGNTLVFSNQTEDDIILREEFEKMTGLTCKFTVTDEKGSPLARGQIDREMLREHVRPGQHMCYICGPEPMLDAMEKELRALDVPKDAIVTEDLD